MAIEIVSFPMKNGDFPLCDSLPEGNIHDTWEDIGVSSSSTQFLGPQVDLFWR